MKVKCAIAVGSLLIAAFFTLASCSSLPLPDTPEQGLLIIPQDLTYGSARESQAWTSGIDLRIKNLKDNKVMEIPAGTGKYTAVALDPGEYQLTGLLLHRMWGNGAGGSPWTESQSMYSGRFLLVADIVKLDEGSLFFEDEKEGKYSYYYSSSAQMAPERKKAILATLKKDPHWPGWEGDTLINFAEQ